MTYPDAHREIAEDFLTSSTEAFVATDEHGVITAWSKGAESTFGLAASEAIGRSVIETIFPIADRPRHRRALAEFAASASDEDFEQKAVVPMLGSDGITFPAEMTVTSLSANGRRFFHIFLRDVSAEEDAKAQAGRLEATLAYMTDHDPLTGLYNRTRFAEELDTALAEAEHGEIGGALVLLDIDNFKLLNDGRGHAAGDSVLRTMARILESHVGELDTVAHFGRDEFAALLHGPYGRAAELRARELVEGLPRGILRALEIPVTISAGVAEYRRGEARAAEELMVAADSALFEAKEKGRGEVVVHDPHTSRFAWAERIRRALATDGLELYAQPIMDVRTGDVVQQELLLRMRGVDGEMLEPAPFLATAERLGMIGDVDRWVIHRGLQVAAEGQAVEINLSGQSLTDAGLIELIRHELETSGADPHDVIFEITETAAISNLGEATDFVRELRELGCQFALDDFGTGFASFHYLKHLPISVLKIDGEFVANVAENETDQRIVQAIIYIAKGLGHKTVAEWVDDEKTLDLLRSWGVDYAQGYHVGRPRPLT